MEIVLLVSTCCMAIAAISYLVSAALFYRINKKGGIK